MLVCLVGDTGQRLHGVVVERVCAQDKISEAARKSKPKSSNRDVAVADS